MADGGVELRHASPREGRYRESAYGGGGFVVSEPVEDSGEGWQRDAQGGETSCVAEVGGGQGEGDVGVRGVAREGRELRPGARQGGPPTAGCALLRGTPALG